MLASYFFEGLSRFTSSHRLHFPVACTQGLIYSKVIQRRFSRLSSIGYPKSAHRFVITQSSYCVLTANRFSHEAKHMTRSITVISMSINTLLLILALISIPAQGYARTLGVDGIDMPATRVATLNSEQEVSAMDFSPDGRYLAAASYFYSTTMHVWDWKSGKQAPVTFDNKKLDPLVNNAIRYSTDGRLIGWCGAATPIWNADSGERVFQNEHDPFIGLCQGIGFAPDGKTVTLALVSSPRRITTLSVRDTSSWQLIWELHTRNFFARTMALSPDGKFIAIGGTLFDEERRKRYQIRIVDVLTRQALRTIEPIPAAGSEAPVGDIALVEWNADSTQIAVGLFGVPADSSPAIKIYDSQTGEEISSEPAPRGTRVRGICYTPNGKYLIELGIGKRVKIWDAKHEKLLQEIPANPTSCAVSRDGRYLALGGSAPSLSNINPLLSLMFPSKGKVLIYELR